MLQPINTSVPFSGIGTVELKTNVTPEMISDLRNVDFYVKKELVKPINNKLITIKNCSYGNHYKVDINYVYFNRLVKLNKLMNKDNYKELLDLVELCEKNKKGWWDVAQDDAVDDLAKNINDDILKRLFLLGIKNGKSNI